MSENLPLQNCGSADQVKRETVPQIYWPAAGGRAHMPVHMSIVIVMLQDNSQHCYTGKENSSNFFFLKETELEMVGGQF